MTGDSKQARICRIETSRRPLLPFLSPNHVGRTRSLFLILYILLFLSPGSAALSVYPANCIAGQPCNVYYKFDTSLADYKCVIDVFGGSEAIRIYSNPSSSKITDEKSISDKISAIEAPIEEKPVEEKPLDGGTQIEPKDEGVASTSATAKVVTKSLDKMMVAKLPRMVGGQYALNIECGDGKTTETALSSVTVEPIAQTVFGTQYEAGKPMKLFTQLSNGDVYSNGTCFLTMYYPDNTKFLNSVVMTPLGENGIYYYDVSSAPSSLGIYMVSVRCSFPSNLGNTTELQYEDGIDTHVDSSNANVNYGADETLYVERTTPTEIALIKPNITYLVGKNYTIIGATLHLFKFGGSGTSNAIDVVPITSSWAESTVTYNTRPTFSMFSCTGNSPTTVTATNDWYSWDMTRCIQNLTDGANSTPYHGFAINATTLSVNKIFYSSDYAGWQLGPNLIITFADTENLSFYSQQVTEIQVVPATFNGSIDLTELIEAVLDTQDRAEDLCVSMGTCDAQWGLDREPETFLGFFSVPPFYNVPLMQVEILSKIAWIYIFILVVVIIIAGKWMYNRMFRRGEKR